ncbi:MAG: hypothetical protein ACOY3E_08130 [Pseudomonadota bacterium]
MDLKDFVKSTLCQIAEGISAASLELAQTNAIVNPSDIVVNSENSQAYGRTRSSSQSVPQNDSRIVEKVDFDIAVSVQEGTETSAGIKVSVMSIGLGAGGKSEAKAGSESRIKFSVPMVFPTGKKL